MSAVGEARHVGREPLALRRDSLCLTFTEIMGGSVSDGIRLWAAARFLKTLVWTPLDSRPAHVARWSACIPSKV